MNHTPSEGGAQRVDHTTDPPGALTWRSAAERNRKLIPWRRAVQTAFAEQPRCLRVAWVLDNLFNGKTGYCNASNPYLADATGLPANKVQEALEKLESDGAIVRVIAAPGRGSQRWRAIYPATELLPSATMMGVGSPLPEGVTGNPQQPGVHNLRKRPRLPRTQLDYARLVARGRDDEAAVRGSTSRLSEQEHEQVRERIRTAASKMEH